MKLALGSVQFGVDYGISNQTGKVSQTEVFKILAEAEQANIQFIDTASSYGDSEKVLGIAPNHRQFHYLGKISPNCSPDKYQNEVRQSLNDLATNHFYAISAHHGNILLGQNGDDHFKALEKLKNSGLCQHIGCSVYSPEEAISLLKRYALDIIQLPASIFDQRIFDPEFIEFIKTQQCKIHIRSIFLQGAVFLSPDSLPEKLQGLAPKLHLLEQYCQQNQTNKLAIALAPFVNHPLIESIIIGCVSNAQLLESIQAYQQAKQLTINTKALAINDDVIINPSKW